MATQTQILIKRDSVSGTVPTTSSIASGELAVNLPDGILYSTNGTVVFSIGANLVNQNITNNSTVANTITVGNSTVNTTINSTSYNFGNNSVYVVANTSGITTSGNVTANNISYKYSFTNTTSTSTGQWWLLGNYVDGGGVVPGQEHGNIRVFTGRSGIGSNANVYNYDSETYVHFRSLPSTSQDVNGFQTVFTYYTLGQSNGISNVAFVSNLPGNTATSIGVYVFIPNTYQVGHSFYEVDLAPVLNWVDAAQTTYTATTITTANSTVSFGEQMFALQSTMLTTNTIYFGNSTINTTQTNTSINSTSYTGTSNNSLYLGGIAAASIPTLAANNTFTGNNIFQGTNTVISSNLTVSANEIYLNANGSYGGAGQLLTSNGSATYWSTVAGATVPGATTDVIFNDAGTTNATAGFTFNKSTNTITVGNSTVSSTINATVYSGTSNNSTYLGGRTAASYPYLSGNNAFTGNNTFGGTNTVFNSNVSFVGANNTFQSNIVLSATMAIVDSTGSQGTAGQVLTSNGTSNVYWATVAGGSTSPGGSNTQIQFNNSGVFGATGGFTFNSTTNTVFIGNSTVNSVSNSSGDYIFDAALNTTVVNTTFFGIGNSTVNTAINSTAHEFSNSSANLVYSMSGVTLNALNTFTIMVAGNNSGTANLTMVANQSTILLSTYYNSNVNSLTLGPGTTGSASLSGNSAVNIQVQQVTVLSAVQNTASQAGKYVWIGSANTIGYANIALTKAAVLVVQGDAAFSNGIVANGTYGNTNSVLAINSTQGVFWSALPLAANRSTMFLSNTAITAPANLTTFFMCGICANGANMAPAVTGNVVVTFNGYLTAPTGTAAGDGILWKAYYGSGTPPAHAAAVAGTQVGITSEYTHPSTITAADVHVPFSSTVLVTGLTLGTGYWFDLAAESAGVISTVAINTVQVTAHEI